MLRMRGVTGLFPKPAGFLKSSKERLETKEEGRLGRREVLREVCPCAHKTVADVEWGASFKLFRYSQVDGSVVLSVWQRSHFHPWK